jgi:hypothetical protein
MPEVKEYRRFTWAEVEAGATVGWVFSSGWFPFQMSWWAWVCREVEADQSRVT